MAKTDKDKNADKAKQYERFYFYEGDNVIYVGDDANYFNTIKYKTLKQYEKLGLEFVQLDVAKFKSYEHCFAELVHYRPKIIYLDFCRNYDIIQKIGKLVTQDGVTHGVPSVAIVDSRPLAEKVNFYPYTFVHFKGGEHHDVIYDAIDLAYPENVKKPEFAQADFSMDVKLFENLKVGYFTPVGLHAEGNFKINKGQIVEVETEIPKDRIPSTRCFVRNLVADNLYYQSKFAYDLEFQFVDEPVFNNEELEEAKKISNKKARMAKFKHIKMDRHKRIDRYHTQIEDSKKQQKEWVEENMDGSVPRKFKMLISDPELTVLKEEDDVLSNQEYNYRFQTSFTEHFTEVFTLKPSIICINLWSEDFVEELIVKSTNPNAKDELVKIKLTDEEEEMKKVVFSEVENKDFDDLNTIIRRIKETKNYRPILVLFNCREYNSKAMQKKYAYPFVMTNEARINLKHIEGMAHVYKLKIENDYEAELKKKAEMMQKVKKDTEDAEGLDVREKIVYMVGDHPYRKASLSIDIAIKKMTESEIVFSCEYQLEKGQKYKLDFPLEMYLTITLNDGQVFHKVDGFYQYRALIHGVDETGKKYIRKFVNEVIFSPMMKERDQEQEAFKALNDAAQKLRAELEEERKEEEQKNDSEVS
ncbi:MAG: hypothetical protein ACPGJV_11775 [Bacteriovoracaceae bacterium]